MHVEEIVYSSIGAVVECVCSLLGLLRDLCILFLGEIQLGCLGWELRDHVQVWRMCGLGESYIVYEMTVQYEQGRLLLEP